MIAFICISMLLLTAFLWYKSRSSKRPNIKFAVILSSLLTLILCLYSALSNPEQQEEDQREEIYRRAVAMKFATSLPPRAQPWRILSFEPPNQGVTGELTIAAIKEALGSRGQITHRLVPSDMSPEGIRRVIFHVKPEIILMQVSLPRDPGELRQLFHGDNDDDPALPPLYLLHVDVGHLKTWLAGKEVTSAIVQKANYQAGGVPDPEDPGVFDQRYLLIDASRLSSLPPEFFAPSK